MKTNQEFDAVNQCIQQGDLTSAARHLESILTRIPGHPDASHLLGCIHYNFGNHAEACKLLIRAVRLKPDAANYRRSLGKVYTAQSQLEQAERCFSYILNSHPGDVASLVELGRIAEKRDKWKEAETHLQRAVELDPTHVGAIYKLATLLYGRGRYLEAIERFKQALALRQESAPIYNALGLAYRRASLPQQARACFSKACRFEPEMAEAFNNLGLLLQDSAKYSAALKCIQHAVFVRPEYAEARYNAGTVLQQMGRMDEAVNAFKEAIRIKSNFAMAYNNLGTCLQRQRRNAEARLCFAKACRIDPILAEAFNNLGLLLKDFGKYQAALKCIQRATDLKPEYAEAFYNAGTVLHHMGRVTEAVTAFKNAIHIKADYSKAYNNLGTCLQHQGRYAEALSCFETAMHIGPYNEAVCRNLGHMYRLNRQLKQSIACTETILSQNPDSIDALILLYEQLRDTCDFQRVQAISVQIASITSESLAKGVRPSESPFLNITRTDDMNVNLSLAQAWSDEIDRSITEKNRLSYKSHKHGTKITLGYLNDGFRDHPATYLISDIFRHHDRKRFNVHVYSFGGSDRNRCRLKIEKECDRFVDLNECDDFEIARTIHEDGCDILVDLKGQTLGSRLSICAYRPAPVQVRYLGMPGTTGSTFFDYLVTDKTVTPPEFAPWYTEKFAYMPNCYQINSKPPTFSSTDNSKYKVGLPEHGFVFCSFCTSYKIDWNIFTSWANILDRVPGSFLWLLKDSDEFASRILSEASRCGINEKRIIFAQRIGHAEHLARLPYADLALDTAIASGAATTSDALWAGLPVVTLLGRHFISRMTASILNSMGLKNLIAYNLKEYEDIAVWLAYNPEELNKIRRQVNRTNLSKTLYNTKRSVRYLEALYEKMWQKHRSGESPALIDIAENH